MTQHACPSRSLAPRGFTLLELLCVVTLLGIVVGLGVGLMGPWLGGHNYRQALGATRQAFERTTLLAQTGHGAVLRCEDNRLIAEANREGTPAIRTYLPRDWTVEDAGFGPGGDVLMEYDASGSSIGGEFFLVDPYGNRTRIEVLGMTGQVIIDRGDETW